LVQPYLTCGIGSIAGIKLPRLVFSYKRPFAAGLAGDNKFDLGAVAVFTGAKNMRQAAEKRVENRMEPLTGSQAGRAHRLAYLLLVMPLFRVFSRHIEPVRRFFVARPCYRKPGGCEWIKGFKKLRNLCAGYLQKLNQKFRANSLRRFYPFCVQLIEKNNLNALFILIIMKEHTKENMAMKTLHNIEVNKGLLWDYDFAPEEFQKESFFIWYLGRLLERGTAAEVKRIPLEVIAQYLDRLHVSSRILRFWKWYLGQN